MTATTPTDDGRDFDEPVSVEGAFGEVEGRRSRNGIGRFLGIPYARAPFGDLRFEKPVPREAFTERFVATTLGATAPQLPYSGAMDRLLPTVAVAGDDILTVNIWTPSADSASTAAAVIVWFHGGSLAHGSNALSSYDGTAFARDGVVFVAVNYRLGPEGFSVFDDGPVNLGLADQLAALRWVSANIAAFGGDPEQVTIMGESAGGNTVSAHLARSDARQLFRRAIIQSGPLEAKTRFDAGRITRAMAKDLRTAPTREGFRRFSPAELLASVARVSGASTPLGGGLGFSLAIDGDLVEDSPLDALTGWPRGRTSGELQVGVPHLRGDDVDLLIGTTTEEYRLWFAPTGLLDRLTRAHLLALRLSQGIPSAAVRAFERSRPGAKPGEIMGALATDVLLRLPAYRLADARAAASGPSDTSRRATTHVYEFAWSSPVDGLGAAHAMELPFVFDGLDSADARALTGPDAPAHLAHDIHAAWVAFATSGDPGWEPWNSTRPVLVFDGAGDPLVRSPRDTDRQALSPSTGRRHERRRRGGRS